MQPCIQLKGDAAIATVIISNPGKLNALTAAMWQELRTAFSALDGDESLRCVVVRGDGDQAFAAGADIAEFAVVRSTREQCRRYHREGAAAVQGQIIAQKRDL